MLIQFAKKKKFLTKYFSEVKRFKLSKPAGKRSDPVHWFVLNSSVQLLKSVVLTMDPTYPSAKISTFITSFYFEQDSVIRYTGKNLALIYF